MTGIIKNLIEYRELMAWNIAVRYKQSCMGILWAVLKPIYAGAHLHGAAQRRRQRQSDSQDLLPARVVPAYPRVDQTADATSCGRMVGTPLYRVHPQPAGRATDAFQNLTLVLLPFSYLYFKRAES